jgi:hypothetical protein
MIQLDTLQLPAGLVWTDEFASSVAQSTKRTLDGGLVVFHTALTGGRPITLASREDTGWLTRAQVEALDLLARSPGGIYILTLRGQAYQVMFRHQEAPAFEAAPLWPLVNPQPGDFYLATIKLMTV